MLPIAVLAVPVLPTPASVVAVLGSEGK
jgi:hypothetical protein